METTTREVTYWLDGEDRIVAVNDAWQAIALANDGEELAAPGILGGTLWDHISDLTTIELHRQMLAQVRRTSAAIRFEYRCDTPTARRRWAMEIAPDRDQRLRVRTWLIREEARDAVALLDPTVPRDDSQLGVCGWCKRVDLGEERWEEVEVAIAELRLFERDRLPLISHGMCPACFEGMTGLLEAGPEEKHPA